MPASVSIDTHATDVLHQTCFGVVVCACLCVKELCALDAFSAQVLTATSNLNNTFVSCVALLWLRAWYISKLLDLIQDMKLGQQTR